MPKPSFEVVNTISNRSFLVRSFKEKAFPSPYHFHPEFELTLITKGEGTRYVGNNMSVYKAGDLLLIGPNLPHCWKTENGEEGELNAKSIVVQFTYDFLGGHFLSKHEVAGIKELLTNSVCGIAFTDMDTCVEEKMHSLVEETNNFRKLILFLEILYQLSVHKNIQLLDHSYVTAEKSSVDKERITPVFAYIVENFQGEIRLETVAKIANMTPNAFCKYFKKITHKTFIETVLEFKINYATQQLVNTNKSIFDICYESGFGDISHFTKVFKSRMLLSPMKYRNKFMQEAGM